jgi:hypothetical protein
MVYCLLDRFARSVVFRAFAQSIEVGLGLMYIKAEKVRKRAQVPEARTPVARREAQWNAGYVEG